MRLHFGAVVTMVAVALDHQGFQVQPEEDVFEGSFDIGGACPGRTGDGDDGMLFGHEWDDSSD